MSRSFELPATLLLFVLAGCGPVASEEGIHERATQHRTVALDTASAKDVHGYSHRIEHSGFALGGSDLQRTSLAENGYAKIVGPNGVFATDLANGYSTAIPNATAHLLELGPYGETGEQHGERALQYFTSAGIPRDQIGGVATNTLVRAFGTSATARAGTPEYVLHAYYSVLRRQVEGVLIPDSVAVVRLNAAGDVVTETVYWPAIPRAVVEQAKDFKAMLADSSRAAEYASRLPVETPAGEVVVRHTPLSYRGAFETFCVYEVSQGAGDASYTRHFDPSGVEVRLPEERVAHAFATE